MKLLEIKNNLVKLEYYNDEEIGLGRFIIIAEENKSYIAQIMNIKATEVSNFAVAKMLFTFSAEGVIENYDGTAPNINSEISFLPSTELLQVLPAETPVQISYLAQSEDVLSLDSSVFEQNFTVFAPKASDKVNFISNCVRQLFQMREKSVIIDNGKYFDKYPRIEFSKDFKLPLNSRLIDYIFDNELDNADEKTRAIIKDIFYDVQSYIETLEDNFLPIDSFVEVVSAQYKELNMPELALLKNKLLKYRDSNIFAQSKEEFQCLEQIIEGKNVIVIGIDNFEEALQKEIINFVHSVLENIDKYVYLFVNLTDENSDKKLLTKMINHDHVFTTFITDNSYKYSQELQSYADNMIIFSPNVKTNDFAAYNTFLEKLNPSECIVTGKLTQGVPFICEMSDLNLDLTIDDVFGDKYVFNPEETDSSDDENEDEIITDDDEYEYYDEDEEAEKISEQTSQEDEDYLENSEFAQEFEDETSEDEGDLEEESEEINFGDAELTEEELEITEDDISEGFENDTEYIPDEDQQMVPVYSADEDLEESDIDFKQGDSVTHPRYGNGVVEKIIKYGNKTLCSISFENVGRRLLDPSISEFEKV